MREFMLHYKHIQQNKKKSENMIMWSEYSQKMYHTMLWNWIGGLWWLGYNKNTGLVHLVNALWGKMEYVESLTVWKVTNLINHTFVFCFKQSWTQNASPALLQINITT